MILPYSLSLLDNHFNSSIKEDIKQDNLSLLSISEIICLSSSLSDIYKEDKSESNINLVTKESEKIANKKKKMFDIKFSNKKRGKAAANEKKNSEHTSLSPDNILSKIQTHFLNFVIFFINDCILSFPLYKKIIFLKFEYKKKSKVSSKYFNKLKNSSIRDLLENVDISDKYKRYDKDINKKNLENLNDHWFKKFFEIKYLDLFSLYYNDGNPLKELSFFGKTIAFSKKTKPFYELLQKYEDSKEDIITITKMFYFNEKTSMDSD